MSDPQSNQPPDPETPDDKVRGVLSDLKKNYRLVENKHVKTWHGFLILGLVVGLIAGILLIANRSGRFDPSYAANGIDTQAPTLPIGLIATPVSPSQINLSWSASTDNIGVSKYIIRRNGTKTLIEPSTTSYQDTGLATSTTYSYTIAARDAVGNNSGQSAAVSATTLLVAPPPVPPGAIKIKRVQADLNPISGTVAEVIGLGVENANDANDSKTLFSDVPPGSYTVRVTDLPGKTERYGICTRSLTSTVYCTVSDFSSVPVCDGKWCTVSSLTVSANMMSKVVFRYEQTAPPTGGLTASQIDTIRKDLALIKSLGLTSVRIISFVRYPQDPDLKSWPANVFVTFPQPTDAELNNLEQYLQLIDQAGLHYEFMFLMPGLGGQYYTYGVTGKDYKAFVDAVWPKILSKNLDRILVGGDLSPGGYSGADPAIVAEHQRWLRDMWPYINAKCPTCNIGLEVGAMNPSSLWQNDVKNIAWVKENLAPSPKFIGMPYYAYPGYFDGWGFPRVGGALNWSGVVKEWYEHVSVAAGNIPIVIDEVGFAPVSPYTYQDVADFFQATLNYFKEKKLPFFIWMFSSDAGAGDFGIVDSSRKFKSFTSVIQNLLQTNPPAPYTAGVQYQPPGSVGWSFIMPCGADCESPSIPLGLSGQAVSPSEIRLSWNASTDNVGVTRYKVLRDGVGIEFSSATSYVDAGLNPGTTYSYAVQAFDARNNKSPRSAVISVKTLPVSVGTGTIKIKRVGFDLTVNSAPATSAWIDSGTPSTANVLNLGNTISAGSHSAYASAVSGYTVMAGICTRVLSDPNECSVSTFSLTPTCDSAKCGLPITVAKDQLTKVVFFYIHR